MHRIRAISNWQPRVHRNAALHTPNRRPLRGKDRLRKWKLLLYHLTSNICYIVVACIWSTTISNRSWTQHYFQFPSTSQCCNYCELRGVFAPRPAHSLFAKFHPGKKSARVVKQFKLIVCKTSSTFRCRRPRRPPPPPPGYGCPTFLRRTRIIRNGFVLEYVKQNWLLRKCYKYH